MPNLGDGKQQEVFEYNEYMSVPRQPLATKIYDFQPHSNLSAATRRPSHLLLPRAFIDPGQYTNQLAE